jgi:outer membrane protein OmpA-like peptidoglycan-associated protein
MRSKRIFAVLIVSLFFAGACVPTTQTVPAGGTEKAPAAPADSGFVEEASKGPVESETAAVAALSVKNIGLSADRLEEELQQALAGSETGSLARQQDVLIIVLRSDAVFAFDSVAIKPGALAEIRRIADVLGLSPQTRIRIESHTDSIGAAISNQRLSEFRAEAIKNELAASNVQAERIEAVGFGAARPVASNKTPDGRQQNRRVKVFIMFENGEA